MFTVGIIGVTGYAGIELLKCLLEHPQVKITYLGSDSRKGEKLSDLFPLWGNKNNKASELTIKGISPAPEISEVPDVVFTALPHGLSMDIVAEWLNIGAKVIGLSADYRLNNIETYEQWYEQKHNNTTLLNQAVYGLSEIFTDNIKETNLVANPGCFPTSVLLALYPLLEEKLIKPTGLIVDSKTGVSGGGKSPKQTFHFPERTENFQAYKIGAHRHTPEMVEKLGLASSGQVELLFTPHLSPMSRGIFSTIYAEPLSKLTEDDLFACYQEFYHDSYFVIPTKELPETKWVSGTNNCLITPKVCPFSGRLIIMSTLDNLIKGASGQAVQNMNLMLDMDEQLGLGKHPVWP